MAASPTLTVIMGCNGAGKTTWKRANYYDRLPLRHYDLDAGAGGVGDWNNGEFQRRALEIAHAELQKANDGDGCPDECIVPGPCQPSRRRRPVVAALDSSLAPSSPWRKSPLHSSGDASRLAALLLGCICPICALVAPCQAGASPLSVQRGVSPRAARPARSPEIGERPHQPHLVALPRDGVLPADALHLAGDNSRGSKYDTPFWRYAKQEAWPRHVRRRERPVVDAETEAGELARRIGLAAECLRNGGRRSAVEPYALFYLSSFMRMTHGLGIRGRGGK